MENEKRQPPRNLASGDPTRSLSQRKKPARRDGTHLPLGPTALDFDNVRAAHDAIESISLNTDCGYSGIRYRARVFYGSAKMWSAEASSPGELLEQVQNFAGSLNG